MTRPAGAGHGVDEELAVALAAEDRRVDPADDRAAGGDERVGDLVADALVDRRVGDHAAAPVDLGPPGLELRLHEQDHRRPRLAQRHQHRDDHAQRDERHVDDHDVDRPADRVRRRVADVRPLEHHDPRVGADARVQLAVADVEGDDLAGARGQQAVGEPAGRRADVERPAAGDVDAEVRRARRRASRRRARRSAAADRSTTTASPAATSRAGLSATAPLTSTRCSPTASAGLGAAGRRAPAGRARRRGAGGCATQPGRDVATLRDAGGADRLLRRRRRLLGRRLRRRRLAFASAGAFFAAAFLAGRLLGRRLLGRRLLGRRLLGRGAFFGRAPSWPAPSSPAAFFGRPPVAARPAPCRRRREAGHERLELVLEVVDAVGQPAELLGDLVLHGLGDLRRRGPAPVDQRCTVASASERRTSPALTKLFTAASACLRDISVNWTPDSSSFCRVFLAIGHANRARRGPGWRRRRRARSATSMATGTSTASPGSVTPERTRANGQPERHGERAVGARPGRRPSAAAPGRCRRAGRSTAAAIGAYGLPATTG